MIRIRTGLFSFFALLVFPGFLLAGPSDDLFAKANKYYQDRDYDNALKTYQQLLVSERPSPEILYNIGNCYFKAGILGKSILFFERASRLNPDDDDISFNLKLASLKAVDKIEPVPAIIYKRWIKSIVESMTISQWSVVSIVCFWLVFVAWSFYLFARSVERKKISFILACLISVLCISSMLFLNECYRLQNIQQHAIVMSASSYVKSSPDERGNDQFILHEGTKVEVLDELGTWKKIRIANGSVGWLKTGDIEII